MTKEHDVLLALLAGSLNRFEAERIGDHCLNTTVSILRQKGVGITGVFEVVPSRGDRGQTNVKRYTVDRTPANVARVHALLGVVPHG